MYEYANSNLERTSPTRTLSFCTKFTSPIMKGANIMIVIVAIVKFVGIMAATYASIMWADNHIIVSDKSENKK